MVSIRGSERKLRRLLAKTAAGAARRFRTLKGASSQHLAEAIWSPMPFARDYGYGRGTPVDRYYIESFVRSQAGHIRGRVLEVGDSSYTRKYGAERVESADVLHAVEGNSNSTIVGDLVTGQGIPVGAFDTFICTQTLNVLPKPWLAAQNIFALLRVGGTAIVTVPGIAQVSRFDMEKWGDFWRYTHLSTRSLFEPYFGSANVAHVVFGNVFSSICLLHGLVVEDVDSSSLEILDEDYPVIIGLVASKAE